MARRRSLPLPTPLIRCLLQGVYNLTICQRGSSVSVAVWNPEKSGSSLVVNTEIKLSDPITTQQFSIMLAALVEFGISKGNANVPSV